MRRESRRAARFRLKRACGAVGALIPTQPGAALGLSALDKFGDPGKSEAVWPSSPMPSTVTSNGRGIRANVSQADTAPKSGEGAAFLSPAKRAVAAASCSKLSRTSFSLLPASVGPTQRSSASATQTRLQSSGRLLQRLEQRFRRIAAGDHQACESALRDRPGKTRGDVRGQPIGQRRGVGVTFHVGEGDRHEGESVGCDVESVACAGPQVSRPDVL